MKILHTSDWHLGRSLYSKKRYHEFEAFLNWLNATIISEKIEILLIAGDIFDTTTPSNRAQALYYQFLCQVAASCCRHIVIIAGNHDSPSFLNAPKTLLRELNIHVVAAITENSEDELIILNQADDDIPELIVCAVPFLRDRDVRLVEAGESIENKEQKLINGIKMHYAELGDLAVKKQQSIFQKTNKNIPIVAMGHLFTAGGKLENGDGVRELYVGSIAHVTASIFPDSIDYLALGHLHVPQKINQSEFKRYSGSPIAMGFGEARQKKSICLIEMEDKDFNDKRGNKDIQVTLLEVPVFQQLEQIKGDWEKISARVLEISLLKKSIWLEIIFQGDTLMPDLREKLEQIIADSEIEILRITNNRIIKQVLSSVDELKTLDDLTSDEVFEKCLITQEISDDQKEGLLHTYQQTLLAIEQDDRLAE